jgi:DNA-binding transcriptional MocR family regulator
MSRVISAQRIATLVGDFPRSPAYLGLAESLRVLIGDGRVGIDVRLPSERDLTGALDVSRTTVTRAYEVLRESGYAEARRGAGTFTTVPGGQRRAHDRSLLPGTGGEDVIDLNCAAHSAPPGLVEAYQRATEQLPATSAARATSRSACRHCRRGSPRRTTPAGSRPPRSRSW